MSLTANFDYCVEISIAKVKEIFHLAFKTEERYPHNVGPITRVFAGREVIINVRVHDDEDRPADLSFLDEKHILFSFPFDLTVETEDAPDPSLSRITMRVRVDIPAKLDVWEEDGGEVLGLSFFDVTANDVTIQTLEGLPTVDINNIRNAIHSKYDTIPHTYTYGDNTLILYDDTRDASLNPPNEATPFNIEADLETHSGTEYLKVRAPIYINVPQANYVSYGRIIFYRELIQTDTTITINMGTEPADAALKTTVELDTNHPAKNLIISQLTPLAVSAINGFGTITEPAFTDAAARQMLKEEIANYINVRRYPVYSPQAPEGEEPLTTPVGFLLVADGVMAILFNRRDSSVADHAPDNFLGSGDLALAVGRARVDEAINEAIEDEFPDLDEGGQHISTDEGDATLKELNVEPSDAGTHGESVGHLWVTGEAEVHIDCWPDPDVSFSGPVYLSGERVDGPDGCEFHVSASAGEFDIGQSCCDVLLDLFIPIIGWIMLAVVESTIDEVGGELAEEIAANQGRVIEPIPPVVNGIAQVESCLTGITITSQGFIFPGEMSVRRLSRSFEDLKDSRDLPKPGSP